MKRSKNRGRQTEKERQDEKNVQKTILDIKKKYGKNAIIKGMNLAEALLRLSATGRLEVINLEYRESFQ